MQARRPGGRGAEKLVNDKTSVQAGRKTCSQPRSCRGTWCFENGDQAPWVLGRPSGKRRAKQFPPRRFQDAPTLNCGRPHAAARSPGQKEPPRAAQPRAHGRGAAAGAGGSARTAAETRRCAGATLEKGSARTDVNAGGGGTAGTAGTRASRSERARVPTKRGTRPTRPARGRAPREPAACGALGSAPHAGSASHSGRVPQPVPGHRSLLPAPPDQAAVALRPRGGRDLGPLLDLQHLACKPEPTCVLPPTWRLPCGRPGHGHTHRGCLPAGRRAATCRGARKECYSEVGKDSCW